MLKYVGGAFAAAAVIGGWLFWKGWKQQFEEEK